MAKKVATKARGEMTAEEVLRAFWEAMCAREREAVKADQRGRALSDTVLRKSYNSIVSEYCTKKPRAYSWPLSYGDPPEYDPETEETLNIVEESPSRVTILTQQHAGFKNKRRFILLRKGDRWLLDSWQWQSGTKTKKWNRGII